MENMIWKCQNTDVEENIKLNVMQFIIDKRSSLVYRGTSHRLSSSEYTEGITIVGEKGNYFRESNLDIDGKKNQIVTEDKFEKHDLKSHSRGPSEHSKYVSFSKYFKIAEQFALGKKEKNNNGFIIMGYIDTSKDEGQYHNVTRSTTDYAEEKEVILLHAMFADRVIGVFSQCSSGEFCVFNVNPALFNKCSEFTPQSFEVDQTDTFKYNKALKNHGYKFETKKYK
ncbi:hypothetical protein [Carnobacterium maltaromaticum]|uniref:hypothetical protein n=1 Tax=Carnobacterium maltaromaticum TaxID=2751 RepID=UPI001E35BCD6|nr:hypothetical protein [Carnobacterium maltaromaticum]